MEDSLRRLQLTQLSILQVVDSFCSENHIRYSLYAGTLLGAVRHHGFIPWDDDLDICMERSEYDRFLKAWEQKKPAGYLLQNKENTPGFTQSFSKVRKEHTTFLQEEWESGRYHTGIFIDVFPIDRIPKSIVKRFRFQWTCMHYQLLCREFAPPKACFPVKIVSQIILLGSRTGWRKLKREQDLAYIKSFGESNLSQVAIETLGTMRVPLPSNLTDHFTKCIFEHQEFPVFSEWDEYLRRKYGDYMTLPPESERKWKHHPIILDFEHDYNELRETHN